METNNKVHIVGTISEKFQFSHEAFGEKFYSTKIKSVRLSGVEDVLPLTISERLMKATCLDEEWTGYTVQVSGQIRSFNKFDSDGKAHLQLSVFAQKISFPVKHLDDVNEVELDGFFCSEPHYRQTPKKREITDIMLAVSRAYDKTDYIPCITWGRNAEYTSILDVGTHVKFTGRFQSREYGKKINEDKYESRTAYEVSVSRLEVIEYGKADGD